MNRNKPFKTLFQEGHDDYKDVSNQFSALKLAAHLNLSLVYPKIDSYYQAVSSASSAIELDPKNEKAFFRRAQAQMALSEFEQAKNDFKTVVEINSVSKLYLCDIFSIST